MADLDETQQATLQRNPWFAQLEAPLRAAIIERARLRNLRDGELLFRRGDAGADWYAVLSGALKVGAIGPQDRELTLTYLEPGAWFGEISIFDGQPRTHDALAQGPTQVLQLTGPAFEAVYAAHPSFARALLQLQCARLRLLFGALEEANALPLEQRLARQLLNLGRSHGHKEPDGALRIALHLPQDALAQLLGTSRQRINQALKAWERDGLLRQRYGEIALIEQPRLRNLAEGGP
ncbi:MAG: Crp/Fnr family transcriptional regulator [Inhella sp.]